MSAINSSISAGRRESLHRSTGLIHEVAHNVGDIRDHAPAYGFTNATNWANNDEKKAKHNAENFAFAAQDCGGRGFGRGP